MAFIFSNQFGSNVQLVGETITDKKPIDITKTPFVTDLPDGIHEFIYIVDGEEKSCNSKMSSFNFDKRKIMNYIVVKNGDYTPSHLLLAVQLRDVDAITVIINKIKKLNIPFVDYKQLQKRYIGDNISAFVLYELGTYYNKVKKYDEAKKYFEVSAEHGNVSSILEMGKYYQFIAKDYRKMVNCYNEILHDTDFNNINVISAIYYFGKYHQYVSKNYDEMKRFYDICVNFNKNIDNANYTEAVIIHYGIYYRDIEHNYNKMLQIWNEYLEGEKDSEDKKAPLFNTIHYLTGTFYLSQKKPNKAIMYLDKTMDFPRADDSPYLLATLNYKNHKSERKLLADICYAATVQLNKNALNYLIEYYSFHDEIKSQVINEAVDIINDTDSVSALNKYNNAIKKYADLINNTTEYEDDDEYYIERFLTLLFETINDKLTDFNRHKYCDYTNSIYEYGTEYKEYGYRDDYYM